MHGVSELVSASLLALMVLIVGGMVVSRIISTVSYGVEAGERQVTEAMLTYRQTVSIITAYIDSSNVLHVVVATGDYPAKLDALYINNTPAAGCVVDSGGSSGPLEGFTIPYYSLAHIRCDLPAGTELVTVILYHRGGSVAALATKR